MNYDVGKSIRMQDIHGVIIPNFKLPGDICVKWETGEVMSYDEAFLDEWCQVEVPAND